MAEGQTTHTHTNRLVNEASPYLLQHARNPVQWHPWGDEAFERARREGKPIFLSIGYSTCHWCHVMEAESFEDEETARMLNRDFISVKVDREERPDIDETYMKAVQVMTGTGGWPLSVFLTPEGKPFYGGTYFPPRAGFGRPSFRQVLAGIGRAWRTQQADLRTSAQSLTEALCRPFFGGPEQMLSPDVLKKAFDTLSRSFGSVRGGFGSAPKFPQQTSLTLLLHYWHRTGEQAALDMVDQTVEAMAQGGIHDHLGGGFHRYSTDAQWLVPHFEKMLYDQALLGRTYIQAYQIGSNPLRATTARDILDYVLRDMTHNDGGFCAAEDADSEGREGAFYVWRRDEIESILDTADAEIFCSHYGVTRQGNFENGENVLHAASSIENIAKRLGRDPEEITVRLTSAHRQIFEHRNTRPRPHRDDKVITSWNGLMISSLACAGAVLDEDRYIQAARRAAEFVLETLWADGRLMRYFRAGRVVEKAFLDDYAFLIQGLLDLFGASFDVRWLRHARILAEQMIDLFADEVEGGFFMTGKDVEPLISRDKPGHDGALPSGNSIAAMVLLKLGTLLMEDRFTQEAERILQRFSGQIAESPTDFTAMLLTLDYRLGPSQEIVIAGDAAEAQPLIKEAGRQFQPNVTLLLRETGTQAQALAELIPFTKDLTPVDGRTTIYTCRDRACLRPLTAAEWLTTRNQRD